MLNGPFGVGKSTIARTSRYRLPNSMIYDPEIVGAALHALTDGIRDPAEKTDDFQDLALWPSLTVLVATQLHQYYHRHLIVPMTIVHPHSSCRYHNGVCRHFAAAVSLLPLSVPPYRLFASPRPWRRLNRVAVAQIAAIHSMLR